MENLEMSGILTAVSEMVVRDLLKVREVRGKTLSGKSVLLSVYLCPYQYLVVQA